MKKGAGRPRALTDQQIAEATHRHFIGGESVNALAKEFGVAESVLRRRIKPNGKAERNPLIELANEVVSVERQKKDLAEKMAFLPTFEQKAVLDISRAMLNITESLAGAAELGAATSKKLAEIAHAQLGKINADDPMGESQEHLQAISALTTMSNNAAQIPLAVIKANNGAIDVGQGVALANPASTGATIEEVRQAIRSSKI